MAISLSSVLGFNLTAKNQHAACSSFGASASKAIQFTSPYSVFGSWRLVKEKQWSMCFSVSDRDQLAADTSDKSSGNAESSPSEDRFSAAGKSPLEARSSDEAGPQSTEVVNGSSVPPNLKKETSSSPNLQSTPKRSPLTARERLKAARVLNRATERKTPKSEMGSKVLALLRESDKGKKRSGLPEAPTNLLDDSKRGMPKQGLTFDFPGGSDLFFIAFSFVFISTLMFATTYIVWKVGAIHFNEY